MTAVKATSTAKPDWTAENAAQVIDNVMAARWDRGAMSPTAAESSSTWSWTAVTAWIPSPTPTRISSASVATVAARWLIESVRALSVSACRAAVSARGLLGS
ncbi:MAG TPA: hypothetical protein VHN80_00045, partial [Kineosporiaceae bacterium]|nr:hypothetical protein [Kineosporiaceae bacterium]